MHNITHMEDDVGLITAQLKRLFHGHDLIDNDIFMFHPYCICEKAGCFWCDDTMKESKLIMMGAVPDLGHLAPNFWHKSSGIRAWWYKHIGKGMEVFSLYSSYNINAIFIDVEGKIEGKKLLHITYEHKILYPR